MADKRTEHVEQREFVQWVRQYTPYLIYAIPNGGARGRSQGATLKAEGVLAGMPDLHIPELRLWIEMKASGGCLSPVQREMHGRLRGQGQTVVTCFSTEEAINVVAARMEDLGMRIERQPIKKVKP